MRNNVVGDTKYPDMAISIVGYIGVLLHSGFGIISSSCHRECAFSIDKAIM